MAKFLILRPQRSHGGCRRLRKSYYYELTTTFVLHLFCYARVTLDEKLGLVLSNIQQQYFFMKTNLFNNIDKHAQNFFDSMISTSSLITVIVSYFIFDSARLYGTEPQSQ